MKKCGWILKGYLSVAFVAAIFLLNGQVAFAWPDLAVTKTGPATAAVGDLISYTLVYTNQGAVTASNVVLTDVFPPQTAPQTNTLGTGVLSGSTITWNLGSLPIKKGGKITFQAQINSSAIVGQFITNVAKIQCSNAESNTNNNTAKAVTCIIAPACTPLTLKPLTNQTACVGGSAVFSTAVTGGTAPYTFQWYKGTGLLTGQTNTTLVLTNLSLNDAGTYNVVAANACSSTTNSATLAVNGPVIIVTPPANQAVCSGDTATFSVSASGVSLAYQWFFGATLLPGQTTSSLVLNNVSATNVGTYSVVVSGACGSSITNSATLTLNSPTTILTPPVNQTTVVGSNVLFSVSATGTALTYQWLFNNQVVGSQSTLTLNNVTTNQAGIYMVIVNGACGSFTNTATLTVLVPVSVITPPVNQTNCPGSTAVFSVTATGTGLNYQWTHGTNTLTGQTNSLLILTNVSTADAGLYSVILNGTLGGPLTNNATLTVNQNTAASPMADQVRNPGDTAVFSTTASGTGPFSYQWLKNGTVISGQTSNSLTLKNVTYANEGIYTVQVGGACNSATQSASLHINLAPAVTLIAPTNGTVYIAPATFALAANATDADGTVTNVGFFAGTNKLGDSTIGNPYAIMPTNIFVPGTYNLTARATDNGGLNSTSAPVIVSVLYGPPTTNVSAVHLNLQTGLFEQTVRVLNPTYSIFAAVRVYVYGITNPLTVYNATGTTNGIPYVQSNLPLAPGSFIDFTIEFYVPVAKVVPNPSYVAQLVPAGANPPPVLGLGQSITRGVMLPNQTFMVEFTNMPGRVYQVEYGSDLKNWLSARPAIVSSNSAVQWIDNGPPGTESAPANTRVRFYRVILLP